MDWSIYACLPFVWLGFILVFGLIRASYEVGLEAPRLAPHEPIYPIFKQKYDLVKLAHVFKYNMFGIPLSNPNALWEAAAETIYPELTEIMKQHISLEHYPERDCFEGSIWIGKKRT